MQENDFSPIENSLNQFITFEQILCTNELRSSCINSYERFSFFKRIF